MINHELKDTETNYSLITTIELIFKKLTNMSTEYISKIKAPRLLKKPKIIELTYFIYRFHKFGKLIPTYSLYFYFYCTKFLIFRYLSNDKITITTAIILSIC